VIEDGWVANHHAQIHVDMGGGCTVVDLGSQTGTFVNGVRTQQQRLSHGMSVRVGQIEIRFLQG
jgi:pSer/pThr/pTyr-binding forkhead associated (FHA) protein